MQRLEPFRRTSRDEFDADPYLRDIVERNLEVAAQCVIDICNRIVALEGARKPADYHEAILIAGEVGAIPVAFAKRLAPIAGFRNVLVHDYVGVDWDLVCRQLQETDDLISFADYIRQWMAAHSVDGPS